MVKGFVRALATAFVFSSLATSLLSQTPPPSLYENLETTRKLLKRDAARKFLKEIFKDDLVITDDMRAKYGIDDKSLKEVSETQVLLLIENFPDFLQTLKDYLAEADGLDAQTPEAQTRREYWRDKFRAILTEPSLREKFKALNDPLEPYTVKTKDGEPAYRQFQLFVDHPRKVNGVEKPADNLKQVWLDFIAGAEASIALNVFDFDLMEVAEALAKRHAEGLEVFLGIDKNVIEAKPEVKAVYDFLRAKGVNAVAVETPGLNHQKMAARDWKLPGKGKVLLSSGNLTQSCIGPEGDLKALTPRPKISVPNANHTITLESDALAAIVHHELSKTLLPDYQYKGREYPLSGAFKVMGPKRADGTETYLVIGFSPRGGLNNINKNMIARVLDSSSGPVRLAQFAFSSQTTLDALLARAKRETKDGRTFDFASVGDTPFAVADWSNFLKMSAVKLVEGPDGQKTFQEDPESPWRTTFSTAEAFNAFREHIRIGPPEYADRKFSLGGTTYEVSAKIHHKVLVSGDISIIGTSFNFSTGAESNNEQIVIIVDPSIASESREMVDALVALSKRSVFQETERRNQFRETKTAPLPTMMEAAPSTKQGKILPNSRWAQCREAFARTGKIQ